jgi:hypothetical protein
MWIAALIVGSGLLQAGLSSGSVDPKVAADWAESAGTPVLDAVKSHPILSTVGIVVVGLAGGLVYLLNKPLKNGEFDRVATVRRVLIKNKGGRGLYTIEYHTPSSNVTEEVYGPPGLVAEKRVLIDYRTFSRSRIIEACDC